MKTNLFLSAIAVLALISCNTKTENAGEVTSTETVEFINEHTSEHSLDWSGEYHGVLPCADCEGIETTVRLNQDKTFTITEEYLKKPTLVIESKGVFNWDKTGLIITLEAEDHLKRSYKVIENGIILLNSQGKENQGELAEYYKLAKI